MEKEFQEFISNITLTSTLSSDAQTKYTGVCEKLFSHFYSGEYDDKKKFLFGSYKTKTNVRPLTSDQDVDVLFKIPQEVYDKYDKYNSNGQAALLQEVKDVLKEKYTTTDKIKAWGKVVLVEFSENHHNIELLPALEQDDKSFLIPNSENGGKWESFDPRAEVNKFNESNNSTSGLTRDLAKMLKTWAHENTSMNYKSCKRLDDIIDFLNDYYPKGKGNECFSKIVFDFFDYMRNNCDDSIFSYINTAYSRAQKALQYDDNGKQIEASCEWRKIFGKEFPKVIANNENRSQSISDTPVRPWFDFKKMK